uniref:Uncharacterized protein n=1 Tax=Amphimedon queenslandica TaxID=400682 RepID=A0A1X7VUD9_AMPQE
MSDIKSETEALICVAQEQALRTNYIKLLAERQYKRDMTRSLSSSIGSFVRNLVWKEGGIGIITSLRG